MTLSFLLSVPLLLFLSIDADKFRLWEVPTSGSTGTLLIP
jgi:hypothetical protein